MVRSASSRVSNHEAPGKGGNDPRLSARPQHGRETFQFAVIRRQAEAQEIVGPLKTPAPDVFCGECSVHLARISAARELE